MAITLACSHCFLPLLEGVTDETGFPRDLPMLCGWCYAEEPPHLRENFIKGTYAESGESKMTDEQRPQVVEASTEPRDGMGPNEVIMLTKRYRVELDAVLQMLKCDTRKSRERSLAVTKLQEAIMWLGMDLKDLGAQNPYPNSYDPSNAIVDPTADGLKL